MKKQVLFIANQNFKNADKSSVEVMLTKLLAIQGISTLEDQKKQLSEKIERMRKTVIILDNNIYENVVKAAECIANNSTFNDFPPPVYATVAMCIGDDIPVSLNLEKSSPFQLLVNAVSVKIPQKGNRLCPEGTFIQMLSALKNVADSMTIPKDKWNWEFVKFESLKETDTIPELKKDMRDIEKTIKIVESEVDDQQQAIYKVNPNTLNEYNKYIQELETNQQDLLKKYQAQAAATLFDLTSKALVVVNNFYSEKPKSLDAYMNNMKKFVAGKTLEECAQWFVDPSDVKKLESTAPPSQDVFEQARAREAAKPKATEDDADWEED